MRRAILGLACLAAAAAGSEGELAVVQAMRSYYAMLGPGGGEEGIGAVRDQILPNFKACRPDTQKSVINQIDKGFEEKYGKSTGFHAVLAEILAGCGDAGINRLRQRVKSSGKRPELRKAAVGALARCGDDGALDLLLQLVFDPEREVAVAAVSACASYAKVKQDRRKAAMRKLVDLFLKVTNDTSGKPPDSKEMKLYGEMTPAMNATLKAFSGGEELDSAKAWDSWLRENVTKPWFEEK